MELHEALGRNGDNGHESLARIHAADHDPDVAVEGLVESSEAALEAIVQITIAAIRELLDKAIEDEPEPTGNYGSMNLFLHDASSTSWALVTFLGG